MPDTLVNLAATTYAVLGALLAVPQLVRLARTRQVSGLSLPGWVNGCLSYGAWLVYLASESSWPYFWGTAVAAVPWAAVTVTLAALSRTTTPSPRAWAPVAAWLTILTFALTASRSGYPDIFGAVLAFSSLWSCGPALVTAWRSTDTRGLSPLTWTLAALEGAASVVAGWGLWAAMTYGALTTVLCLGIVGRVAHTRLRSRDDREQREEAGEPALAAAC